MDYMLKEIVRFEEVFTSIVLTTVSAKTELGRSHCVQYSLLRSSSFEIYALIIGCLHTFKRRDVKVHR